MKTWIILICSLIIGIEGYSQAWSKQRRHLFKIEYRSFASDSLQNVHILEFIDDSIVELRSIPRFPSKAVKVVLNYWIEGKYLFIRLNRENPITHHMLLEYGWEQFINGIKLYRDHQLLIDEENQILYVKEKRLKKRYRNYVILDNREYKFKTGIVNSNGIVKKNGRGNLLLKRKLKGMQKEEIEKYELLIWRGTEAYNRFGYKYVFGVFEFRKK
jgi:hypothetical protein